MKQWCALYVFLYSYAPRLTPQPTVLPTTWISRHAIMRDLAAKVQGWPWKEHVQRSPNRRHHHSLCKGIRQGGTQAVRVETRLLQYWQEQVALDARFPVWQVTDCRSGWRRIVSMGLCKNDVSPLLKHWSYVFLEQTNQYVTDVVSGVPLGRALGLYPLSGRTS